MYILVFMLQTRRTEEEMKRKILVNTYGSAFPLKMDLDRQILSRYGFSPCIDAGSLLVCSKFEY